MLSWGFANEGVCARWGPHVAKADNEKVKGAEKLKGLNKDMAEQTHVTIA